MRGHAAADRQDALRNLHADDIFGGSLQTDENNLGHLAALNLFFRVFRREDNLTTGSAGRSSQALANRLGLLQLGSVKLRVQQGIQLLGLDAQNRFVLVDHALIHQVNGDLQGSLCGTLAVTGLQHEQLAVFNGEFHVLHVLVMLFQTGGNLHELVVHFGHFFLQLGNRGGSTDTGHDVFALGIDQILTEQTLFTGSGVTGKGHAGTGVVAGVTERHALYIDGAPVVGDFVHAAVHVRTGVIPGTEYGANRFDQLLLGILGEFLPLMGLIEGLELLHQSLHIVGIQLYVLRYALFFLHLVDDLLKLALGQFHNDVREHLNETAIGVISKTGVVGQLGQTLDSLIIQTEVQNGIHHAGHGSTGTGTNRNQQGVVDIAELLADQFFQVSQVGENLCLDILIDLTAICIILGAGFRGNGKALGHGHAGLGHFGQVRTLTAEELSHVLVAFRELVHILVAHGYLPPKNFKIGNPIPNLTS